MLAQGGRLARGRHAPEQENEQNRYEAQEAKSPEGVHVGEQRRLLDQEGVGARHRLARGGDGPEAGREERALSGEEVPVGGLVGGEVPDHQRLVRLGARVTIAVAAEMPMLPPRLRSRLKIPLALPICSFRRVPSATTEIGTKMKPIPRPLRTLAQSSELRAMARLMSPNMKAATARTRLSRTVESGSPTVVKVGAAPPLWLSA
jgi:hypothetical protein